MSSSARILAALPGRTLAGPTTSDRPSASWALVKDKEVAQKMNKFMELNTIGVSGPQLLALPRYSRQS
ncbi:hypothetical protein ZWY2020_058578 [Hordeum vulgare]|nr:hypothetical protein ZWY2020_058578 [Hordeum vulgare]